ncbi:MAG: molybdopterin molybdotransferase MoeA [Rhodocyclaceae bacterium]|nr:molybdopterin molybdotransferase MoeA [Rhodocyclaceae bacterium]
MLSFEAALAQLQTAATPVTATEVVATNDALGRVLAHDLVSTIAVPPLDNSAMDGYAIRVCDIQAGVTIPVSQRIAAGHVGQALDRGTAARIFTGAPVPDGADAVVMQEHCVETRVEENAQVSFLHAMRSGDNIRRQGEDIAVGTVVLRQGTQLRAAELGVAASVGRAQLSVLRRLKVALFSTGDELAMPGEALKPGGIYNSNRATLSALLQGMGCEVTDFGIVADNLQSTCEFLSTAAQNHDLILTSGGVSVGEEDHVKAAVASMGEIGLWKIAIKPGKPLAFGRIFPVGAEALHGGMSASRSANTPPNKATSFIGLPGNPVASFVTFLMLVRPYILKSQGLPNTPPIVQKMRADFAWAGDKRREFLRVRRNAEGGLDLFPNQSSGVLTSCAWADGLVSNPPSCAIASGDTVAYFSFTELGAR